MTPGQAHRLAVLIVDDVEHILRAHLRRLQSCDVTTATSTADAKTVIAQLEQIDIAICDYDLGDGTGIDVLVEVKRRFPKARRYLVSGNVAAIPTEASQVAQQIIDKPSSALDRLLTNINNGTV